MERCEVFIKVVVANSSGLMLDGLLKDLQPGHYRYRIHSAELSSDWEFAFGEVTTAWCTHRALSDRSNFIWDLMLIFWGGKETAGPGFSSKSG